MRFLNELNPDYDPMANFDNLIFAFCAICAICAAIPPHYSPRVVRTKYGSLRGILLTPNNIKNSASTSGTASAAPASTVEAFLGVPYAAPPVGNLRYLPPASPGPWPGVRLSSSPGPACPQRPPDLSNRTAALLRMSRSRYFQLQRMAPLLSNQSEDCLYLNLYSPFNGTGTPGLPIVVFIHGNSYSFGAGHLLDGAPLAGMGQIVITLNYRLGVLGFLQTSLSPTPGQLRGTSKKAVPKQGNFGLLDIIAALIWLKDNARFFGGDPDNVCLVGQGTGAALVNLLMLSPIARGLFKRAVLMSGSALSPWAMVRDPGRVKEEVAKQMRCSLDKNPTLGPGQIDMIDIGDCLRKKPLGALLSVDLETPRFLADFGPFIDGSVIESDPLIAMEGGSEEFASMQLLMGVTTTESVHEISDVDLRIGFEEDRRDRVIRTLVRNTYMYHLNEIFYVLKNEYTDWDKPAPNAVHVRDSVLELLGDGLTVAPLLRTAQLHAGRGGDTYLYHFAHYRNGGDTESERLGSLSGDDLDALGLDATDGSLQHYTSGTTGTNNNSSATAVSDLFLHYILAFAATGDPNSSLMPNNEANSKSEPKRMKWDRYERTTQAYLSMSARPRVRTHYRGHQMSIWLQLIPQLHQPGPGDVSMTHHQLSTSDELDFEGVVLPPTITRSPPMLMSSSATPDMASFPDRILECTTNVTADQVSSPTLSSILGVSAGEKDNDGQVIVILSQSAALSVTLAIGIFLLLINLVLFAAIYRQRTHRNQRLNRKEVEQDEGLFDSTSDVREICVHPPPRLLSVNGQVPRDKYESDSDFGYPRPETTLASPSFYMAHSSNPAHQYHHEIISVPIPNPPPPPRSSTPYHEGDHSLQDNGGVTCSGTLTRGRTLLTRTNSFKNPATPSAKKKVQIQEITV